jgi:hypothetical protein
MSIRETGLAVEQSLLTQEPGMSPAPHAAASRGHHGQDVAGLVPQRHFIFAQADDLCDRLWQFPCHER